MLPEFAVALDLKTRFDWWAWYDRWFNHSFRQSMYGEGEPIDLYLDPKTKDYALALPLVETLGHGSDGLAFKVELTAYEGQTQIDSSSLDVQVLSDPHEQQNPLPYLITQGGELLQSNPDQQL